MANPETDGSDLTVVIDGAAFDDIASFYDEANRRFMADEDWQLGPSLDALNDLLYGGFGAIGGASRVTLVWKDLEKSRRDLGPAATAAWLEEKLLRPDVFDQHAIREQLARLADGTGPTYFDLIMEIIADHENITLVGR